MPLREFESVLKAKHDPPGGQPKVPDFSSAPSSFLTRSPENDFVELLWENGHVVMQGQSNRPPKRSSSFFPGSVPSLIGGGGGGKSKEKEAKDHAAVAAAKSGGRYHHALHATGPSGQAPLGGGGHQEDDLVPWLNCPLDDYCSEFLSEFTGVNPASLVPTDRISCFGQAPRDSHASFDNAINGGSRAPTGGGSSEVSRYPHSNPYHQLFQLPQQYHNLGSSTATRPKEPDLMMGAADSPAPAKVLIKQDLTTTPPSKPMHHPNNNSNGGSSSSTTTPVMNFSHFSRPVALVKANLLSVDRGIRGIIDQKATSTAAAASSNPLESTVIESAGGFKNVSASSHDDRHLDLVSAEAKSNPPVQPPSEETASGQPAETTATIRLQEKAAACRNSRNHKKSADSPSNGKAAPAAADYSSICHDSNFKAAGVHESTEINHREPAIASSSVCSAIGGAASPATNDHRNRPKWNKCPDGEEYSECPSEDHEDDSADVRRSVTDKLGTSKKRSRAAEVHNLSERRRRDRINEKMRALQELIPNCNKVDKASMLDEAIEYLKTLQMQVQIMSMGGGLCMPPMMLPPGMQSMRPPHHMGPFSPMAVGMGMGMGMGFGMGMLDMSRPPLMPIPRMHAGPQYPCAAASMPAAAGLHGMRGSAANLHMFGMPMSMPHPPPPFVPLTGIPASVNQPVASSAAAAAAAAEAAPVQASADHSAPPSSQQDRQLSTLEQVAKTSADNTPAEAPRQANRECFELPSIVRMDNQQPPNVGGNCEAISSGDGMHLPP